MQYSKEEIIEYFDRQLNQFIDSEWNGLMECYGLNEKESYDLILDCIEKYISKDIPFQDKLSQITEDLKFKFIGLGPLSSLDRAKLAKEHFDNFFAKLHILNRCSEA